MWFGSAAGRTGVAGFLTRVRTHARAHKRTPACPPAHLPPPPTSLPYPPPPRTHTAPAERLERVGA